jgi:ABC-2 type transport system ATP-binding protein
VEPAIVVRGLTKRYGGRTVVDGVSFEVAPGEVFAILGPNGAGKTTTVEILEGFRRPDGGQARVLGLDPVQEGAALKPCIGMMLQGGGVYPQVRPLEALRLFASFFADPERPEDLLRQVGLEGVAATRFRRLSGGERQRLQLALALVGRPELVFLDEPTTAMDPQARRDTWRLIRDLKGRGVTVVLTTHFMDEAEQLADRVAIVNAGRVVAMDTPARLSAEHAAQVGFAVDRPIDRHALAAHLRGLTVWSERPHHYVLDVAPSPEVVAALAAWLAQKGVLLTELRAGGGTLEDVYLRLTGDGAVSSDPGDLAADAAA